MNLNVVVLAGTLAAEPEVRQLDNGSRLVRYLITVKATEPRRRVDVLPVTLWDPDPELSSGSERGDRIFATGSLQRRFWDAAGGRKSTVELIAHHVEIEPAEVGEEGGTG